MTIASKVRHMRAPVKILSGRVDELMFKYLLPVRAIRAMWTRSRAGSIRPKVGRPVAKALAISGLLMNTTAGEAVGEQHLQENKNNHPYELFLTLGNVIDQTENIEN